MEGYGQPLIVPAAPSGTRRRWVPVIALSVAFVVAAAFAVVQTTKVSNVNGELEDTQSQLTETRDELDTTRTDLELAQGSVDSLTDEVAEQDARLVACAEANTYAVRSDKALHDAIGQIVPAAFGSSDYRFDAALARYRSLSRLWAQAANACEPGAGYSFS